MKTINWYLDMGILGAEIKGNFEVEDDTTEEEIEKTAWKTVQEKVNWGWWFVDN